MTPPHGGEGQSLPATGERLVPELQHEELVHAEHIARYRFAAHLAAGKRVLDAASGEGYGTAILAAAGVESIVGVDLDPKVVAHARSAYGLRFEEADVGALPFDDGSFDLVVSFETIEHVSDAPSVLVELRRVLSEDGVLVISTPNTSEYLVENEFHTREFTHHEFAELLGEFFPSVQMLLQHNWLVSTVSDETFAAERTGQARLDLELYKLVGIAEGGELYTIALCASVPQGTPAAVAATAGTDEAHALAQRLTSAEDAAESWHREYVGAKETAEAWHREYQAAKDTAESWHREYREAERLAREIHDRFQAELLTVYGSVSWRITEPLRKAAARIRERRA